MKRKISVFTATRAEYHLLYRLLKRIVNDIELELDLIVSGTHLSFDYGHTVDTIIADGFDVNDRIETINSDITIDEIIAKTMVECGKHFRKISPDLLIVLGDRYELMGVVIAAANAQIPIAHIHGGETTFGAIDEAVRHAVTKFSYLHFTGCEQYRRRVIQLGENPHRVFNCGTLGVENIIHEKLMTKKELEDDLSFDLTNYALVTFHPVTLERESAQEQINELVNALTEFKEMNYIITKANADYGGNVINNELERLTKNNPRVKLISSLGLVRYLSALKYCRMVIGNSSSGILEAPSFEIPTVNIGDRQAGRIKSISVLDCMPRKEDILRAMRIANGEQFRKSIRGMTQVYGEGNASEIIIREIKKAFNEGINLKKEFYDL